MASSGKRKTTMAKLTRERKLQERRLDKQARKDARKQAAAQQRDQAANGPSYDIGHTGDPDADQPDLEPAVTRAATDPGQGGESG